MKNFQKTHVTDAPRTELHDLLNLTGAEVSLNHLPAGGGVPFVHSHKQNEELYGILSGRGSFTLDGETVALEAGDWLRVAPEVKRQLHAAPDSPISFICIQTKAGSLTEWTGSDGIIG